MSDRCPKCSTRAPATEAGARALYARRGVTRVGADGVSRPVLWEDLPHVSRHALRADAAAVIAAAASLTVREGAR